MLLKQRVQEPVYARTARPIDPVDLIDQPVQIGANQLDQGFGLFRLSALSPGRRSGGRGINSGFSIILPP